ncbi:tyrosine decarboxylase MfnA [Halorubellus sp. JP-L1]|uniref:tyrosine decarboxylase MfnA n=1 Tax=Halorubellus sp. JP-L1 TaxID=2715753 RepID=UPI00140A6A53|nr:tyrosine decarboxylase MfnA [Halorubellus sp. JP-L1]NHN42414.1 tyrosine decarboxylase MfnA [Halorubellus sp. JP-L1]
MRGQPQDFDRVLSSMCTEPHPAAREAAERFLATNPGDPATYQSVADLETEVVEMLGDVVGVADPSGYVASGGTEANIQAVRMARNRAVTQTPNVVVPESAHFSFKKAADVLGVELRVTSLEDDYTADVGAVERFCDEDTVLVVGVAGSTEYGRVDPIPELAAVGHEYGALVHVDAAWGGFVLPFTDHDWSFADASIDTMTIDPHKMGQAAIPAGGLLARDAELFDALAVDTPYLESASQATLTGTRSGAGVASAHAALRALWPDGYREASQRAQANAEWLADALAAAGLNVVDPELPLVAASVTDEAFEALREREWRLSRTSDGELRVVCMPHVTREMLESFVADVESVTATVARGGR